MSMVVGTFLVLLLFTVLVLVYSIFRDGGDTLLYLREEKETEPTKPPKEKKENEGEGKYSGEDENYSVTVTDDTVDLSALLVSSDDDFPELDRDADFSEIAKQLDPIQRR